MSTAVGNSWTGEYTRDRRQRAPNNSKKDVAGVGGMFKKWKEGTRENGVSRT